MESAEIAKVDWRLAGDEIEIEGFDDDYDGGACDEGHD